MRKVIAVFGICNTASVNIYEAESDYVLAGINAQEPEECEIEYNADVEPYFKFGGWRYY